MAMQVAHEWLHRRQAHCRWLVSALVVSEASMKSDHLETILRDGKQF